MSWVPVRSSTSRGATGSATTVFSRARAACPSRAPGLTVRQSVQVGVRAHVPERECLPAPGRRGAVNTGLRVRPLSSLGRPGWHRRPSGSSPARSPPARRRHGGPWAVYPSPSPRSGAWRGPGLRCVRRESPPQGRRSRPASSGRPGVHSRCWLSRCPTAPRCGTHLPRTTRWLRITARDDPCWWLVRLRKDGVNLRKNSRPTLSPTPRHAPTCGEPGFEASAGLPHAHVRAGPVSLCWCATASRRSPSRRTPQTGSANRASPSGSGSSSRSRSDCSPAPTSVPHQSNASPSVRFSMQYRRKAWAFATMPTSPVRRAASSYQSNTMAACALRSKWSVAN